MKLARQYSLLGGAWPVLVGLDTRILPGDFGRSALAHIFTLNNEGASRPRSFEVIPHTGETTRSSADCRSITSLNGLSVSNFLQLLNFVLESDSGSWIDIRLLECFGGPIEGHGRI